MDVDTALQRFRDMPVDPRLAAMDHAVLDALTARRPGRPLSGGLIGAVSAFALGIGLLASTLPGGAAEPARPMASLGAASALAPSSLLGTGE